MELVTTPAGEPSRRPSSGYRCWKDINRRSNNVGRPIYLPCRDIPISVSFKSAMGLKDEDFPVTTALEDVCSQGVSAVPWIRTSLAVRRHSSLQVCTLSTLSQSRRSEHPLVHWDMPNKYRWNLASHSTYMARSISSLVSREISWPVPPSTVVNTCTSRSRGTRVYWGTRRGRKFFLDPLQRTGAKERKNVP